MSFIAALVVMHRSLLEKYFDPKLSSSLLFSSIESLTCTRIGRRTTIIGKIKHPLGNSEIDRCICMLSVSPHNTEFLALRPKGADPAHA